MALIKTICGKTPQFGKNCYLAENATIIGDVVMGDQCSVWFNTIVRGDVNYIKIGDRVNIQDGTCLHTLYQKAAIEIGNDVTVGHNVCLHGCKIEDNVLIGMGSTVLDNAHVCSGSVVAAGALVLARTEIGPGELWAGVPAKLVKKLSEADIDRIVTPLPKHYQYWAEEYLKEI